MFNTCAYSSQEMYKYMKPVQNCTGFIIYSAPAFVCIPVSLHVARLYTFQS